jgi:hypothetical protein
MLEREEHQRRLAARWYKAADTRPPPAVSDREGFELQFDAVHSCRVDKTLF